MDDRSNCNIPISRSNVISPPPQCNVQEQPRGIQTTPSTSTASLQFKSYSDLCVADEDLPSANIADLWTKPLKLPFTSTTSSLGKSKSSERRRKTQRTPSRRNFLPPTKLTFDDLDSEEQSLCSKQEVSRAGYRRSMSFPQTNSLGETPGCNNKRLKLQQEEKSPYEELMLSKAVLKENNGFESSSTSSLTPAVKKLFVKSQSDSILSSSCIKTAVEKIEGDPTLIGDASSTYILPFKNDGKHADLKEISRETLANLLETKEDCEISFKIIDCRYPYEFAGGHLRGAINLYTKKQIQDALLENKLSLQMHSSKDNATREILIFHCEFSSHRGPSLCRHLRYIDRTSNASNYPHLFYPELYVLYGGYKDFFEKFSHLCEPQEYVSMSQPEYAEKYRKYKSESKL